MPVFTPDDVGAAAASRFRPLLDLRDGCTQDPVLDRLPVPVQLFEPVGEATCLVAVFREQELERRPRMAQAAGGIDPRREAEPDAARIDRRRVDVCHPHQRLQPGLLRPREHAQTRDRE